MTQSRELLPPAHSLRLTAREYLIVGGGLAGIAVIGWAYMIYTAWAMNYMDAVAMWMPPPASARWAFMDFVMLFVMWTVMMIAMMVPSVTSMVMVFTAVNRDKARKDPSYVPTFVFVLGYLVAWCGFSLFVSLAQWPLHTAGVLNRMMDPNSYLFSGIVLILAGLYQWTPLKEACLNLCRSPLGFLMAHWREGKLGALNMGIRHGLFCVGCCWALMLVLFAVGVMNMLWVLLIAMFVLLEKALPAPRLMRGFSGFALILWGASWVLA